MQITIPYSEAREHIQEGDVLMFNGKGIISWFIKRYGSGTHSHVGVAHWDNETLLCVEFREFKGGRCVNLSTQVDLPKVVVDVFRPARIIEYDNNVRHEWTPEVASKITSLMVRLTGLPYGWSNIWKLVKHYTPFVRLASQNMKDDTPTDVFVCSTAVAYAFRSIYVDPVPYVADAAVAPADLARSPLFEYKFTIEKD